MKNRQQDSVKNHAQQGADTTQSEPYSIGAATPFDFECKNLTACGGLLPVATMLERLGFQQLVEETLTVKRVARATSMYQFVLAMVLAVYVGFSRLHHLRFVEREPMLTGILKVLRLPPQCTFWRFLASQHLGVAKQLLSVQLEMRERVWQAARGFEGRHVGYRHTVHTLFGQQMGGRKGYNPKNKGKKSFQPIPTFLAETREYIRRVAQRRPPHRTGDRAAPGGRVGSTARAGGEDLCTRRFGIYCGDAVAAYEARGVQFIISARKTGRLVEELKAAEWKPSPRTDADGQCEFQYQPEDWDKAYRFLALRYKKKPKPATADELEQYQLFDTPEYTYLVFVTNMKRTIDLLVWFYNQRAGAENLIKEVNNDARLRAYPSGRWMMSCNHFQLTMLAYNLLLADAVQPRGGGQSGNAAAHHLGEARLRFLFLAPKIWRHAGRVGVRYSDHYAEQGIFQ